MASKALKLRLKAEASELAHPTCQYQTKAAHQETRANDVAAMPSQDNLLPVPPSKAILAGFPPTCPVLYTDTNVTPNISIKGIVETVFVDLSPGCKREYFYQVACVEQGKSFIARESQLQWALRSPVWVRLQYENPDSAMKRACTIVGCYKQDMYTTLYSVQEVNAGTCLFHGVAMDCIQYRPENDTTGQHVEPSATAAASAPNVANVGSVITSTQAVLTPVMPVSSTAAVKKHDERAVSRVTSSPRKRPITEAHHELQGCSAEFALPQWMEALCLVHDFQHRISSFVQDCSGCRATILESLNRDKDQSSTLMGQSIFVYGKNYTAVERAITAVSDFLQEYVNKGDKKRLAAELQMGWKRNNDEDVKIPFGIDDEGGKGTSQSNVPRATKTTIPKKAKKARSPSEEGEIRSTGSDSTTKVLFHCQSEAVRCPPIQIASEKGIETQIALLTQPLAPTGEEELDIATPAEEEYPGLVKRIIKIPVFANDSLIKEALIGPDEKIRDYIFSETGCDMILKFPNGSVLDPIQVELTGAFDDGDFDFAQRWAENRIVSTVVEDQKGRMLFSLAKENSYGASEGHARYQRSPYDLKTWVWMNVVEVPDGFKPCKGLFIDKNGKAIKDIVRSTKCSDIQLVDTLPRHVFLSSESLDAVNAATEAVKDRVLWALNEYKKRKYGSKKKW